MSRTHPFTTSRLRVETSLHPLSAFCPCFASILEVQRSNSPGKENTKLSRGILDRGMHILSLTAPSCANMATTLVDPSLGMHAIQTTQHVLALISGTRGPSATLAATTNIRFESVALKLLPPFFRASSWSSISIILIRLSTIHFHCSSFQSRLRAKQTNRQAERRGSSLHLTASRS